MVVGCRTQQLLKNGKNVSASFTSCVSMYSPVGVRYRNYVKTALHSEFTKDTFVRLYCDCRRFYSTDYQWPNEIKANFTKLTAQETALLSHISVSVAEENVSPVAAYDEIESLIQNINTHVGGELLVISDDSLHLDTNALRVALFKWVGQVIQDKYKGNVLLQFPLKKAANLEIQLRTNQLKGLIGDRGVSLSFLRSALPHGRSRRSIPSAVASVAKNVFKFFLTFIDSQINNVLLRLSNDLMALYITDVPTHPILRRVVSLSNAVVKEVAQAITHIRSGINNAFDAVIRGRNSTTTDVIEVTNSTSGEKIRAKRDLVEFWLGDVIDSVSLEDQVGIPRNRRRRDVSTTIGELIAKIKKLVISFTEVLNASFKEYITTRLNKTVYITMGKLIVSPLAKVCDTFINVILPCGNCTSLG